MDSPGAIRREGSRSDSFFQIQKDIDQAVDISALNETGVGISEIGQMSVASYVDIAICS